MSNIWAKNKLYTNCVYYFVDLKIIDIVRLNP